MQGLLVYEQQNQCSLKEGLNIFIAVIIFAMLFQLEKQKVVNVSVLYEKDDLIMTIKLKESFSVKYSNTKIQVLSFM